MKERPILFSGEMVRAIVSDRKSQTRRVINPQPPKWVRFASLAFGSLWNFVQGGTPVCRNAPTKCPYGEVGDRLWVRETFWCTNDSDSDDYSSWDCGSTLSLGEKYSEVDYCATPEYLNPPKLEGEQTFHPHSNAEPGDWWLAPPEKWDETDDDRVKRGEWIFQPWPYFTKHPSIFMPRWASRITLEITKIRVERLHEISAADCEAEGISREPYKNLMVNAMRADYHQLWDKINAERGFGWKKNPWVWVIEFKRVEVAQ